MLVALSKFLLFAIAAIASTGNTAVQYIRSDNYRTICSVCLEKLISNPVQEDASHLAVCPHAKQHIFHAECLAKALVNKNESRMACPLCRGDCRVMLRRALISRPMRGTTESLQYKMLGLMNALPKSRLCEVLDSMNFTRSEYDCLAKGLARFQFSQLNSAVAARIVDIYNIADLYEYLTSKSIGYISPEAYEIAFSKCFTSELSASQILAIFKRLLQRASADKAERQLNAKNFISAVVSFPHAQLSYDDACALLDGLHENGLFDSAQVLLENIEIRHAIDIKQIPVIFKRYLCMRNNDRLAMCRYTWLHIVHMRGLDIEQNWRIIKNACKYLRAMGRAERCKIIDMLRVVYAQLTKKPLENENAVKKIQKAGEEYRKDADLAPVLESLMKNGVMRTVAYASQEDSMLLFHSMLDNWNIRLSKTVYVLFSDFKASIELDLIILRRFLGVVEKYNSEFTSYAMALARRQYFGYGMLVDMLEILLKSETTIAKALCTWLLLVADHRGFFSKLNKNEAEALFKMFVRDKFLLGIALLERPLGRQPGYKKIVKENANAILVAYFDLLHTLQEYIAHRYVNNYVFAVWSKNIMLCMRILFRSSKTTTCMVCLTHFMMNISGSAYFVDNVSSAEVASLIRLLLSQNRAIAAKCIDLFFVGVRSEKHAYAAKMVLFKTLIALQLTEDDVAVMNAAGFRLELVDAKLSYRKRNGSMKPIAPNEISGRVAKMIRIADRNCLLRLIRDKLE